MGLMFSADEIVDIAVEIEKNGAAFYDEVVKSTQNQQVKDLAVYLREEEKKHIRAFEQLRAPLSKYQPALESYPGEYEAYMKALAAERVFTGDITPKVLLEKASSDAEALLIAIGFEKDSILFFFEIRNFVPKSELEAIEELINQERSHLRQLSELRREALHTP